MGAPLFPRRTVEDAAVDLILRADAFQRYRVSADRTVADMERRWQENRISREVAPVRPDMP